MGLKHTLGTVICPEQSAFVADRDNFDNTMVADHELADIRKVFDSLNWDFLKHCMLIMRFPPSFMDWIMASDSSPYYHINGGIEGISGLQANPSKISLYFGGVDSDLKAIILAATSFIVGEFPFRYLDLPLVNARITKDMYQPLLDKIKEKIIHWANRTLSYAGKTLLVNSFIFKEK
ncbi:uncharacterized protein LOC141589992 [Silene latifolia]|uniref:uncharacterized protein LOC141589992 n=1 Tax=Silene latifolia TaxID=37657 RepID=UPI003D77AF1B